MTMRCIFNYCRLAFLTDGFNTLSSVLSPRSYIPACDMTYETPSKTLHYRTKKKNILFMICLQILYFVSMLLFILYAFYIFFICYPIMFYVFFTLRFGLHCFTPNLFLRMGRCNGSYNFGFFFFCKARYCLNFINFYVTEANSHSLLPGQQIPLRSICFRCIEFRQCRDSLLY